MANLGAVKAHCLRGSCDFFSPAKCSRVTHTRSRPRVEQLSGLFARHLNSGIFSQRRFNSSSGDRCKRLVSPRNGSMAQQGDSGFARDEPVHVSRIPEGEAVRQGSSPKKLEAEHWEVVQFQAVEKKSKNIVAFYLASGLLALGLCFSFCKPAMAKIVENQPTVTAKLNEKGEVEVQDRALETSGEEGDEVSAEKNGEKADDFEPVFGEGSDLTSDPTEILLRSYLERHPNDLKALQALLYMRLKKGEINAAHAVIDKLIELEPDQLEWKFIRAQAFEFVGELEQARQAFQEIIELRPLSARALQVRRSFTPTVAITWKFLTRVEGGTFGMPNIFKCSQHDPDSDGWTATFLYMLYRKPPPVKLSFKLTMLRSYRGFKVYGKYSEC